MSRKTTAPLLPSPPQNLAHQPVYALPYEQSDGFVPGGTDMRFLSLGLAQYNPDAVSIKAMRHTENRWSRQSEELPPHRVVDMTLFLARVLLAEDRDGVPIPAGSFDQQERALEILPDPHRTPAQRRQFDAFMDGEGVRLKRRLSALADELIRLREVGKV